MKKFILFSVVIFFTTATVYAGGISVDAGLTPGQDRWLLRIQYRYMQEYNSSMEVKNQIFPLILAYGVTSKFSILMRMMYVNRLVEQDSRIYKNGFSDPAILLKFKVYRKNTADFVFGFALYCATNIPAGSSELSYQVWNPEIGLSFSFRPRYLSFDFTSSYTRIDLTEKMEVRLNDRVSLNIAVSSMIPLNHSEFAISPVLEFTYNRELDYSTRDDKTLENLFISPGFTFIRSSWILELLFQTPVMQQKNPQAIRSKSRVITGIRYMF
jgi:hypothetical protein